MKLIKYIFSMSGWVIAGVYYVKYDMKQSNKHKLQNIIQRKTKILYGYFKKICERFEN